MEQVLSLITMLACSPSHRETTGQLKYSTFDLSIQETASPPASRGTLPLLHRKLPSVASLALWPEVLAFQSIHVYVQQQKTTNRSRSFRWLPRAFDYYKFPQRLRQQNASDMKM